VNAFFQRFFLANRLCMALKKAEACSLECNRKRYVTIHRRITQDSREQSAKSQQFHAICFALTATKRDSMTNIDWQRFDTGCIPLRRCSLCRHQTKFDAAAEPKYYCARLKQWTSPMFECPFWDAQEEWKEWYSYCTSAKV